MKTLLKALSFGTKKSDIHSNAKPRAESNLNQALKKTKAKWKTLWKDIDFNSLETTLLQADVGVDYTTKIIEKIKKSKPNDVLEAVKIELIETLKKHKKPLKNNNKSGVGLEVILIVGINGAGKTTTVGKMAHHLSKNHKVAIAAADTYRAAAVSQCEQWGNKLSIPVYKNTQSNDSSAACYTAIKQAEKDAIQTLLIDTAGRLNNKTNLMDELKKNRRVISSINPTYPAQILLVIDANYGLNAVSQVKSFLEALPEIDGIILTKCDGTAKGGSIFSIVDTCQIPILFIGTGERPEDLEPFNPILFVNELFS
tara:strand:- start:1766 stop:2701 length:936 start_codon:yes stop_codon:yes gene_type:complete